MVEASLYQPRQRWRVGAAFGAAALIHFAAIGLASIHQHKEIGEEPPFQPGIPEVVIESPFTSDDSTPPPDVVAPSPMPNPADQSFRQERPSPPPIRRPTNRPATAMVRERNGFPGSLNLSSAKVLALSAPRPEYPYEARRQKITGNGIVVMTVDSVSGRVTDVLMEESTGSPVLDNAAITVFRRWRFKSGTVSRVKSLITFTMAGAQLVPVLVLVTVLRF